MLALVLFHHAKRSHYTEEYLYVIDILGALLAQSTRWVKVKLRIPAAEGPRLHYVKGRMPLLQSLVFAQRERKALSMPIDPGFARFVDAFEDSPSLTHLELYVSNIKGWKCDWSSMVVLRLKSLLTADGLVAALSQSTRLEELEVVWPDPYMNLVPEQIEIAPSMITLASLKTLALPSNVFNLLEVLTAPGLERLYIKFTNGDEHARFVTAFLSRSACPPGHLVLEHASPAVAVEVLSAIPGLPSLEIRHYNDVDGIIKVFNCNLAEGASLIGPRLKSFHVSFKGDLKQGAIVELSAMVASRARNVEVDALQELTLWADYSWMKIDLAPLQSQCKEQGVKLTVGGGLSAFM